MRVAFSNTLVELATKVPNIMLLTADLGYSVFEPFIEKLPKQFLNVGIAEQNMTGMAAGMAIEGKIPFIYSIVPFSTMRNFEQIRNDICYQNLNVKIVGVGAGFSYGPYGHTHHGLEDIGILRTLPNLTICTPGDPIETAFVTKQAAKIHGPVYIRLGRGGEPAVYQPEQKFTFGKGTIIQEGSDITIIAISTMVYTAKKIAQTLKKKGIKVRLISLHTIKPLDTAVVVDSAKRTKYIFTIEEHSVIGGLGSAVAEVIAQSSSSAKLSIIGVQDKFTKVIGKQEYMRKANGLSIEQITEKILKIL